MIAIGLLSTSHGFSQSSRTLSSSTFDVASVKPAPERVCQIIYYPARMIGTACTMRQYISAAYGVAELQISKGPSWLYSDRYSIEGTTGGIPRSKGDLRLMLQGLLAARFRFLAHRETETRRVSALVIDKNGPRLASDERKEDAVQPIGSAPGRVSVMAMRAMDMSELANYLTDLLRFPIYLGDQGRLPPPVIDETGLTGTYDITLESISLLPDEDALNNLQRALQRNGLKLVAKSMPITVIVVDRVDRPSPN